MWTQDVQEMLKAWAEKMPYCLIRSIRQNLYGDIVIEAELPDPEFWIWDVHEKTLRNSKK